MISHLERSFKKIGAELKFVNANVRQTTAVRIDIVTAGGAEHFEMAVRKESSNDLELSVLELRPEDRHLVLLARTLDRTGKSVGKEHFLCGHDERHLFVAAVEGVSTVAAAKASLKPAFILSQETGLNTAKRNRRKTNVFIRQGEWFFLPVDINPASLLIRRNEPLVRGNGSKAHWAQFACRHGGEPVRVCSEYPNGLTEKEYVELINRQPRARFFGWRQMMRNMGVFVKGRISHPDHATVVLNGWHRVLMNEERRVESIAFLD